MKTGGDMKLERAGVRGTTERGVYAASTVAFGKSDRPVAFLRTLKRPEGRAPESASSPRRLRSVAGFTMIEIALALAIIGFALVAIIGVLPAGMSVQRDNRESTIVNFDANYLMDAIESGPTGGASLNDLTNHIIAITNYLTLCNSAGVPQGHPQVIAYTMTNTVTPNGQYPSYLTNGQNIIALLTAPKYISYGANGDFYSNYATADFRAFTGSLSDQGTSQSAESFAFTYRVYPEIVYFYASGQNVPPSNPNSVGDPNVQVRLVAGQLQNNLTQVRLRFRWPVFANGQVGTSRLTFRTAVAGYRAQGAVDVAPTLSWLLQQGTYLGQ